MTILVFGSTGQVGIELAKLDGVRSLSRAEADLENPEACANLIGESDCTAVINAAAYTAVDKAEEDEARAQVINGDAPAAMAQAAAAKGVPFVHISTDYVFEGGGETPFAPSDPTGPLGAYGRTKLAGEDAVRAAGGAYAILRTSWVFSAHGNNFVKTMLRLAETRDALTVVGDQHGGPTPAAAIAEACHTIARQLADTPEKSGTYHFAGDAGHDLGGLCARGFCRSGRGRERRGYPDQRLSHACHPPAQFADGLQRHDRRFRHRAARLARAPETGDRTAS